MIWKKNISTTNSFLRKKSMIFVMSLELIMFVD